MAYASLTTYLFKRLQKIFSGTELQEERPHGGLYNYNGGQIELFHKKWKGFIGDRLTEPRLMSLWKA